LGVLKDIFDNVSDMRDRGSCRFCSEGHCNAFDMQCPWLGISVNVSGGISDAHACCKPKEDDILWTDV
jgi:hypothetical protein